MPHMAGHWYDVNCTWCGTSLRVRGPRPCRDIDPTPISELGPCPACKMTGQPGAWWAVPTFDFEIESPEHLQQLIDQGQQPTLDFDTPEEQAAILEARRKINPWASNDLKDTE